ncbi:anti-sigma-D factor RsdA [Nocardia sp. NPDC051570]|uniref:anti-sigma-D factor RsdA n=1 Tax=Nocardia sp. NPDC051570 TaxID=3364324 RepID=UPI00379A1600
MARDGERGRGDWKARLGSQNSDPYAEASGDSGPVDIAAVRRDDALIDAISGDGPVATDSAEEYQLASLLANWRAEVVEAPMPAGPDLDTIVAAVNQEIGARQSRVNAGSKGHLRLVRPLMGAAAALALIIGGMTAFSYNAQPGDPLWRVKEVVFTQQAQTTIAKQADDSLYEAQTALKQGNPARAKAALDSAKANATQVNDPDRKNELEKKVNDLIAKLPPNLQDLLPLTSLPKGTSEPGTPSTDGQPKDQTAGSPSAPPTVDPRILGTGEPSGGSGTEPSGNVPPTHSPPPSVPTTAEPPTTAPPVTQEPPTHEPPAPTTIASPGTGGPAPTGPATAPSPPVGQPSAPVVAPTTIIMPRPGAGGIAPGEPKR